MAFHYFFDLPVYRLKREKYYAGRNEYIQKMLSLAGYSENASSFLHDQDNPYQSDNIRAYRSHLEKKYGGCWEFNEIIGYIRLYFCGSQVRGEYFAIINQRITKSRTKILEYKTHKFSPEVSIKHPISTITILRAIQQYIFNCKQKLPKRYIDTCHFETLAPHIDWESLFLSNSFNEPKFVSSAKISS
jgi:hypothetical protein